MTTGSVAILNVGSGDTKLSFDKSNPAECIRAARIVRDMLRRGYALLVDVGGGVFQRAHDFDENTCEYIIADFDPLVTEAEDKREQTQTSQPSPAQGDAAIPKRRGRPKKVAIPADRARAVAVGRSAGG